MKKSTISTIAVAFALIGCGSTYKPATSQDRAAIDFQDAQNMQVFILYESENCTNPILAARPFELKEPLYLQPERRVSLTFNWLTSDKVCHIQAAFTPQPHGKYGILTRIDGKNCHLSLIDRNNKDTSDQTRFQQMKFTPSLGIANKCEPTEAIYK